MEREKPHILIFSTAYLPFVGGAEVAVKEITERLPGYRFSLITARLDPMLPRRERIGAVDVYRVGLGSSFDKCLLPPMGWWRAVRVHKKDPLHAAWSMMAGWAGIAAGFFKKTHRNVPLITTLQEGDEEEHLARYVLGNGMLYRRLIRPWHTLPVRCADRITAISSYLCERARRAGARGEIALIPNGVDTERFGGAHVGDDARALRRRFTKAKNDVLLLTTGRLVEKNGVDDIIEALAYLPEHVRFVSVGSGPLEVKLKQQAEELGLSGRVYFEPFVVHKNLPKYLHAADIFVRPSRSEGMGISFIEAMAAGLPVIATQVGGIADFLFDPERDTDKKPTGKAVNPHDPQGIAHAVSWYLKHSDERARITGNAKAMVERMYTWDAVAAQMKREGFEAAMGR